MFCVSLPKAEPCEPWACLFRGDSDGARCLQPPYTLTGAVSSHGRKGSIMFCPGWASAKPATATVLMCIGCVAETDDDVMLELELPFWIDAGDVRVSVTSLGVSVEVRNTLSIQRTYWRNR